MPIPVASLKPAPSHVPVRPRNSEELLDRIEERTRRRLAGGLVSLHRRGKLSFGRAWVPLASTGAGIGVFGTWRIACRALPVLRGISRLRPRPSLSLLSLFALLRR